MDGHDPDDPWPPWWHWYPDVDDYAVEAAAAGMLGDYYYTDDPLEWQGGGGGDFGQAPAVNSSPPPPPPPPRDKVPPSDDVMAAWLYPIVSGEDRAGTGGADVDGVTVTGSAQVPAATGPSEPPMGTGSFGAMKTESRRKLPSTDLTYAGVVKAPHDSINTRSDDGSSERRKLQAATTAAAGGRLTSRTTRSSHHSAGTHSVTEKRRRCKITERLRTLQQLVPGCDKCNQASTLEQTIQYMKSLQQQLQAMKTTPVTAGALYPVVRLAPPPPPPAATGHQGTVAAGGGAGGVLHVRPVAAAVGTTMVPLFRGSVLPYPHYYYYHHHAEMMPPPPAAAPAPANLCRPAAAPSAAPAAAAAAAGDHGGVARSSAEKTESPDGSEGSRGSRGSESTDWAADVVRTSETTMD